MPSLDAARLGAAEMPGAQADPHHRDRRQVQYVYLILGNRRQRQIVLVNHLLGQNLPVLCGDFGLACHLVRVMNQVVIVENDFAICQE